MNQKITFLFLFFALAASNFITFSNYEDDKCKGRLESATIQPLGCFLTPSFTVSGDATVTSYSCSKAAGHSKIKISQYHRNDTKCTTQPKDVSTFLGNCTSSSEAFCGSTFQPATEKDTVYVQYGGDATCSHPSFQSFTIFYGVQNECEDGNVCQQNYFGTWEKMFCGEEFDSTRYVDSKK